jgi:hypothetical protein
MNMPVRRPVPATITYLPERIAALPESAQARIARLFYIERSDGVCELPETMLEWVERQLGPIETVRHQRVIRVSNRVTYEGALYNELRARRPMRFQPPSTAAQGEDIFADPLRTTSADVFGRVRGAYGITASNVSRWDGQCAVTIFDEPDPLKFTRAHLRDYFRIANDWARLANRHDAQARYFVWMWNGGVKAGASIPHAHAQMALGRGMHYARIEQLRAGALGYRRAYGVSYFDDVLAAHQDMGLTFQAAGVAGFVNLAAARNKDIMLLGTAIDDTLADALADTLRALIDKTGTAAFNVVLLAPPLFAGAQEDWSGFPVMLRLCDRGSPAMLSADIGALDIYAHNTISADPFALHTSLALPGDFPTDKLVASA